MPQDTDRKPLHEPVVSQPLRVLLLEDVVTEAQLVEDELRRNRIPFATTRVATRQDFERALKREPPDLIIADYVLPSFDGMSALALARATCPEVPFILVSGRITEETAVEAVQNGATDYLFKDNLSRLVPSVLRAMQEVRERRELHEAEEALRESELRYRLLVEHSHDAIFQLDRDGRVVFANPTTEHIFGYRPAEFLEDPRLLEKILRPRSRRTYDDVRDEFRSEGTLTEDTVEWAWSRKDGEQVFTETVLTNLVAENGRVLGFQLIIRDISDEKRAANELRESYEKLRRTFGQTVRCLASAVEKRDPYTGGHHQRVGQLAQRIAQHMGLPSEQAEGILFTGLLHDIGKIHIPAEILSKPGELSEVERMFIHTHCQVGYDILEGIEFPWPVARVVLQHHERMDGSGYPAGLAGKFILPEARILGVADFVEGMASHRPYRPAHGIDRALLELMKRRGAEFDPQVVDACLKVFGEEGFQFLPGNNAHHRAEGPSA